MCVRFIFIILGGAALMAAPTRAQDLELQKRILQQEALRAVREAQDELRRALAEVREAQGIQREQIETARELLQRSSSTPPAVPPPFPALNPVPTFSAEQRGAGAQTERFSRKIKLERNGSVSVSNVSGEIVVTTVSGDEVSIEATKWTTGDRSELSNVQIQVDAHPNRIDVRTDYLRRRFGLFNERVSVDYAISVPTWAAVDAHSVSGTVKVTGVEGAVRIETVSGSIVTSATLRLEQAKTVSGNIDLTGAMANGDLSAQSVSGSVRATGLKCRGLNVQTVSGDMRLADVTCDRLEAKTVSGSMEYSGALVGGGRYDVNSFSGNVRFALSSATGFELNADTFSGAIRSDMPVTIGGTPAVGALARPDRRSIRARSGDGSAILDVRTFSGNITIAKR